MWEKKVLLFSTITLFFAPFFQNATLVAAKVVDAHSREL